MVHEVGGQQDGLIGGGLEARILLPDAASDGAEEVRLDRPKLAETVLGHHPAGLRVALAAPVERRPLELGAEPPPGGVEDARALGHVLFAGPVAGNYGDLVSHPVVT